MDGDPRAGGVAGFRGVRDVLAAGLHPRVRSSADGSHYTSEGLLPMVPGIDGVGRTAEGELLYFVAPDDAVGTFGERAVVDRRRAVGLPAGTDPVPVAAAMNPAMSSWVALRRRGVEVVGSSVLVLGATGNAGRTALSVARLLGATDVVAAGRPRDGVLAVGTQEFAAAVPRVDVVLDYLWGPSAVDALREVLTHRTDRAQPLTWIQIGSVAGAEASIPSAFLRAANVSLKGSGQGSVSTLDIVAELLALVTEILAGRIPAEATTAPMSSIGEVWSESTVAGTRTVLVP